MTYTSRAACEGEEETYWQYERNEHNEEDDYSNDDAKDRRYAGRFSQITRRFVGMWSTFRHFATSQHYSTAPTKHINTHTHLCAVAELKSPLLRFSSDPRFTY